MVKDLIIVGAGGFGREVLQWAKHCNAVKSQWNIKGFIDDNADALKGFECDRQIIGSIKEYAIQDNEVFAIAVAIPRVKKAIVEQLKSRGAVFTQIIHPAAVLSEFCSIGEGVIITANAKISPNVVIGDYVTLLGSGLGHDAEVGAFSTITGNCSINGYVKVGEGAFVGSNSCIAPGKKIGAWSLVAMGSMVVRDVKEFTKVMGNPAKRIDI